MGGGFVVEAQVALRGGDRQFISLDRVIRAMRDTGADMQEKCKETSKGGLAANAIGCCGLFQAERTKGAA
ncbi:L-serine ammonia-lyase, iron-sulfur-dependent, subunit alpha [Halomonas sp. KAO]|nr:L-serine ammonia-lyase, iron-sulfur-dependent, subunit alpha [Halomonas sp. KAO]